MAENTPDKKLLEYLNKFGVGNYTDITFFVDEIFPYPDVKTLNSYLNHGQRILDFLSILQDSGFIKFKKDNGLKATILPSGVQYLISPHGFIKNSSFSFLIDNNETVYQSSLDLEREVKNEIKPIVDEITRTIPKHPKIRSRVEMINWIIGIIVGLIFIWQLFFPDFFKHETYSKNPIVKNEIDTINNIKKYKKAGNHSIVKNKPKQDTPQGNTNVLFVPPNISTFQNYSLLETKNPSYNSSYIPNVLSLVQHASSTEQRHVDSSDIKEIIDFMPNKMYRVNINYAINDSETQTFGNEIYHRLNLDSVYLIGKFYFGSYNFEIPFEQRIKFGFFKEVHDRFDMAQNKDNSIDVWIIRMK